MLTTSPLSSKSREELVNDISKETIKSIPQISNYNKGSVFRLFIEVVASFLATIYKTLDNLKPQRFSQTATGEYLDLKAQELGLSRRNATKTRGYVIVSREQFSDNLKLPAGKIFSSKPDSLGNSHRFSTLQETIMPKGESSISVLVEAETAGSDFNLLPNQISEISTHISGIDSVSNPSNWIVSAGTDTETDENLRLRCLAVWKGLSGSNKDAYINWAKSVESIENVKVLPLARGAGSVDIICTTFGNGIPSDELLAQVSNAIELKRPIGADVVVRPPTEQILNVGVEAIFLPNYNIEKRLIEDKVLDYFRSLSIGDDFEPSALSAMIMQIDGIKSLRLSHNDTIRISELQIARLGTLTITLSNASEA
ncbi:MAG: baseplate J/gp47 family protein [Brevinema sp.]